MGPLSRYLQNIDTSQQKTKMAGVLVTKKKLRTAIILDRQCLIFMTGHEINSP